MQPTIYFGPEKKSLSAPVPAGVRRQLSVIGTIAGKEADSGLRDGRASDTLTHRSVLSGIWSTAKMAVEDPYGGLSDGELAARVDAGDGKALNALCRRHYHSVFQFAYRLTQNRLEAEDCTQEAFARFIRSWSRWQVRDRGAGPWLSTIVRHVAADHWSRALGHPQGGNPLVPDEATPGADEVLLDREQTQAVAEALTRLGSPCEELIALLFGKSLTLKKAAEVLHDTHEAVKKRYQRCLKRLQAELEEWSAP
jgi:RNA polymerase sigma-70 factor (ECF subfamily)